MDVNEDGNDAQRCGIGCVIIRVLDGEDEEQ